MFKKLFSWGKSGSESGAVVQSGVDTSMNYCPVCGDEYRSDIVRCHSCEVDLVSGKEKLNQVTKKEQEVAARSMDISPDDQLVTIRNGKLRDLKPLQILLAKETIPALLTGESVGCGKG